MSLEFPEFSVVDLTHPLSANIPLYPGDKPLKLTRDKQAQKKGVIQNVMTVGEHAGTHDVLRQVDSAGRHRGALGLDRARRRHQAVPGWGSRAHRPQRWPRRR